MTVATFNYSKLLREPTEVVDAAERGDVVLERRDGPNLRLMLDMRAEETTEALGMVARMLSSALHRPDARTVIGSSFEASLPWLDWLPEPERASALDDMVRSLLACVETKAFAPFAQLVHEWQDTAVIHSEGLAPEATRPLTGTGTALSRPS
jgi:hypothetical protein